MVKYARVVLGLCLLATIALVLALALPSSVFALDFSGSGDTTVGPFYLPGGLTTFSWTYSSTTPNNFIVHLHDANTGATVDMLVNEIGSGGSGSVVVDPYGTNPLPAGNYKLSIDAPGPWTASIAPVTAPPTTNLTFSGSGIKAVGPFSLPGGDTTFNYTYSYATSDNFIVWLYSVDTGVAVDLLVNEVASTGSGSVVVDPYGSDPLPAGSYMLDVYAPGGPWTMGLVPSGTPPDTVTSAIDVVSPNPATAGSSVSFSGHGIDSLGHSFTAYQWRSSINGVLSSSASFSTSSLSVGTHTIYFKVQCSNGTWSPEVSRTLTVSGVAPVATTLAGTSGTKTTAYNGAISIYADLKAGTTPLSGMPVFLEYSSNGITGWTRATATITQPIAGRYQTSVRRTTRLFYRFRFAGDAVYAASTGPRTTVYPKAYLTNPYAPTYAYRSRAFTTYGYIKPRHTSGSYPVRIYKYRYVSGVWKSYGYVTAKASNYSSYTKYTKALSLPYAGKWRLRTYHAGDSANAATWSSGYDYVTVR